MRSGVRRWLVPAISLALAACTSPTVVSPTPSAGVASPTPGSSASAGGPSGGGTASPSPGRPVSSGDPLDGGPPPSSPPLPPTSDDLIGQALAAGQIDWPTSILYRIWAQWGDPQLPANLVGAGPSEEDDLGIGVAPFLFRSDIPDAVYAQMQPYLVRPTDPTSAFYPSSSAPPAASRPTLHAALARQAANDTSALQGCTSTEPWASQNGTLPYRVWASCTGDYQSAIATAVQAMSEIWGPETQLMGSPLPDDGSGGDGSIDVYLVDSTNQCPANRSPCETLPARAAGAAVQADPASNTQKPAMAKSGYILVPRSEAADPAYLKFELIHELFHVLEFAHNIDGLSTESALYWQVEADAKWAQAWLGSQPAQGITGLIRPKVYLPYFDLKFQSRDIPLNQPNTDADHAAYRSFIWPFFAQQQTAGAQFMGQIWKALEGASSFAAADQATDRVFPFTDQFPEFALRNLNLQLAPNDPIKPRYVDLDGTFPDGGTPWGDRHKSAIEVSVLPAGQAQDIPEQLAPLTSHYRNATVDSGVHEVELDFGKMSGGTIRADAMVEVNNPDGTSSWERRTLSPGRTTWCLDDPANSFADFLLIVSNASFKDGDAAAGSFSVTGRDACARVHGTLLWTDHVTQTTGSGTGTGTTRVWIDVLLKENGPDSYWDDGSTYSVDGSWTHPDIPAPSIYDCAGVNLFATIKGAGTFLLNGSGGGEIGLTTNYPSPGIAELVASVGATKHEHSESVGPASCAGVDDGPGAVGADLPTIVWCNSLAGEPTASGTMSGDGRSIDMTCSESKRHDFGPVAFTVHEVTVSGTIYIEPTDQPSP